MSEQPGLPNQVRDFDEPDIFNPPPLPGTSPRGESEAEPAPETGDETVTLASLIDSIAGCGPSHLHALTAAGITTVSGLAKLGLDTLTSLEGIGSKTALKLLDKAQAIAGKPEPEPGGDDDEIPEWADFGKGDDDQDDAIVPELMPGESYDPDVYLDFERRDEDAIIRQEMTGLAPGDFVYDLEIWVKSRGRSVKRKVYGISWEGTRELKRWYRYIDLKIDTEEVERQGLLGVLATATAIDRYTGNTTQAIKFVPYMGTRNDGSQYENPFALEHAQSKAKRNACQEILPQWLQRRLIELHKRGVKALTPELLGIEHRYMHEGDPEAHRREVAAPPDNSPSEAPRKLDSSTLERLWEKIHILGPRADKNADEKRSLMKARLFIMAEGDVSAARGWIRRITAGEDFDGYESVDKIPARGSSPTALDVAYGKIKSAFHDWCDKRGLDHGYVEARQPTAKDREAAEELGDAGATKEYFGATQLALKQRDYDLDEEDRLKALVRFCGLPETDVLTPAHYAMGARLADQVLDTYQRAGFGAGQQEHAA